MLDKVLDKVRDVPLLGDIVDKPLDAVEGTLDLLQDPEKLLEMLKGQVSPEAAELLQLLIAMLQEGHDPFAPEAPAGGGHAPAGGGGHAPAGGGGHAPAGGGGHGSPSKSPVGREVDGPGGFLWKPVSESDGNLVVLLPPELKGQVSSVEIQDAAGNTIDTGRFSGDQKNGGRPHFRFDKPGSAYGEGLTAVAKTTDGREIRFDVGTGGERHD